MSQSKKNPISYIIFRTGTCFQIYCIINYNPYLFHGILIRGLFFINIR